VFYRTFILNFTFSVVLLFLKISLYITVSIESSLQDLFIASVVIGLSLKITESHSFPPVLCERGKRLSKTGVSFNCVAESSDSGASLAPSHCIYHKRTISPSRI